MTLLSVQNLSLSASGKSLVDNISFQVEPGETLAIVGESGSGKTLSALSVLDLLPPGITRDAGHIMLDDCDITTATPAQKQKLRGGIAGMIFQEPMSSLNPLQRVGKQIAEAMLLHGKFTKKTLRSRVIDLLHEVGLADAPPSGVEILTRAGCELSPTGRLLFLIADEPTTALDVTLEKQILDLIAREQKSRGLGVLLITHDLDLVRRYADRVLVMDHGRAIEANSGAELFTNPKHKQTQRLLAARHFSPPPPLPADAPVLLDARNLSVKFPILRGALRRKIGEIAAVDDISFTLHAGETLGLVGESGSGKSTIGLLLLRLIKFQGTVLFAGHELCQLSKRELNVLRADLQIVFQDPYGSLAPRLTIGDIIAEGLTLHEKHLTRAERTARVASALREVGLPADSAQRYPHEFSGGQRQRIAIARAVILQPKILVLDEPTSALDVTVQAEILHLLRSLQTRHGIAYLFISHDLRVIQALAHRVVVLNAGKIVEMGPAGAIFAAPQAPYTQTLLAAAGLNLHPSVAPARI